MTLNVGTGASPSLHQQQQAHSPQILESTSPRRLYTVGSPTSSTLKPAIIPSNSTFQAVPPQFLPLLSPHQELTSQPRSFSTEQTYQARATSQSRKGVSPGRRRHDSKSPERARGASGRQGDGRKSYQQQTAGSKYNPLAMQGRKNELGQSITHQRPPVKYGRPNTSIQSNSLPSTPNHNPSSTLSRSPSPPCPLDSPRSAASEPVFAVPFTKSQYGGCMYETALINARRRMPYSLGIEKLGKEKPMQERLSPEQEKKLTNDMLDMFEGLKPNEESSERRRKFLEKLGRLLNDEWPGHDIQVHAFGSTENHLCMSDSDVDVCITTRWKDLEHVCKLSKALAKHGMERVVCVPGAKVPIVKIWDPEYQVACDMNVNNTLALDNTKMIKTYVEIDDRVRPLAMIIKHWTKQRILNDAAGGGTLSSYTWICMILNFLQTRDPPILPALHQRPHKKRPPISGVDISFDDDIESLRGFGLNNTETLGELLFAFFKKYGHELDYEKNVISVRHGKLLSKEEKNWQYLQNNRLCVEEPFNTNRNLGNTADDSSVRGLHLEFRRVHKILAEKADIATCCELYKFPLEEQHVLLQSHPPPPPCPVRISSGGARGKSRGRFSERARGGGLNRSKRISGGGSYANLPLQPQYITPDLYGYIQSPQEQILALQAQLQVQARVHAQVQLAQAHAVQAHVHAQMHSQQSQSQSSSTSVNSMGSTSNHQDTLVALHPLASYAYLAQLCGMNIYYPNQLYPEGSSTPTSPRIVNDNKHGFGRGRRQNDYNPGSRSQSQPPPMPEMYATSNYGQGTSTTGVPGSEDEDFADHSSNGNPATPPEEESDEYMGYYTIGGSLQHLPAVVDSVDEEEPFLEQKSNVDRYKRLSQERLPPPLLGKSRDSSPLALERHGFACDIPGALCLDSAVPRDHSSDDRGPVIVNGSISVTSASYADAALSNISPPSEVLYSYDGSLSGIGLNGSDGTSDTPVMQSKGDLGHPRLFAQKLLEVHKQAAGNRPENDVASPNMVQHSNDCASAPVSTPGLLSSPKSTPQPSQLIPDDDIEDINTSTRLSPNPRQRAATRELLWSNARAPPLDALKSKGNGSSQEDLGLPLTPVPEASASSSATNKKGSESEPPKPSGSRPRGKHRVNNHKKPSAASIEKSVPKNGADSKQKNGASSNGTKTNPNSKSGSKESWEQTKSQNKGTKKRSQKTADAAPLNESERKGG